MDYRLLPENPWSRFARAGRNPAQEDVPPEVSTPRELEAQGRNILALTQPNAAPSPVNSRMDQLRREARRLKTTATMLTPDQYDVAVANTLATEPYKAVQAANKNMEDYIQNYGMMPTNIDLSPIAAGLGLSPNLIATLKPHETPEEKSYKMIAALDKIQGNRMDLLKTAASSVQAQKGGLLSELYSAQLLNNAGLKPIMPRFNPEGKAPIGDFIKRYEASPVMKGYYERQRTTELADTLLAEGTANAMDQLKYIAAKHFDSGGRLSDLDFERAGGGDKSIAGLLKNQYMVWKNNRVLPKNLEYMKMLISAMNNADERQADDYAKRLSTTAPKFFRGNIPPEELYYTLRPEGDFGTSEKTRQEQKKAEDKNSETQFEKRFMDAIQNYRPKKREPKSIPQNKFRTLLDALRRQ